MNGVYYGADATSIFNGLDYIFFSTELEKVGPDQKRWGMSRGQPTWRGRVNAIATKQY